MTEYGVYKNINRDQYEAKILVDPSNSRVRLLAYQGEPEKMIADLKQICLVHHCGKIICAVYPHDHRVFMENEFLLEGEISGFFKGKTAQFFSFFFDQKRAKSDFLAKEDEIISYCSRNYQPVDLSEERNLELRSAQKEDAEKISSLFREVFPIYPTPMDQPEYVKKMIDEDVLFKIAEKDGALVSVASADMNRRFLHAEITDCATHKSYRGRGYLNKLVFSLENDLRSSGYLTAFSLARARSFGMNIVLSKNDYQYSGRHINNCMIMDGFEDMNIWVKQLQK